MKIKLNKKNIIVILIFICIFILGIILICNGRKIAKNKKMQNEFFPQEEISEEQYRQTMVLLYFINSSTGEIESETRLIDVKILINNPYEILISMLISGGKREDLVSYIPIETKINKIELENKTLKINFSDEFYEVDNMENKNKIIIIIEKTLKELLEIENVEITCMEKIIK